MEPESSLPRSQEPATEHINAIILIRVPCIFYYLYYDQQMHIYSPNYHTPTCSTVPAQQ